MTTERNAPAELGRLVVVGSSAGGIEALSVLVSTLQPGFAAPVVLAQHLDPRRRSNLEQILGRRSALPIVVVPDQEPVALRPGTVYVVPANRHVAIHDGHVGLEGDHSDRPRPSVDLLLSTAAQSYGENLIAVVLTGSGSDGAAGAVEVSNAGGTVIIQNPATALYPSMPLALPPPAVDYVIDLERIGPLLHELVDGMAQPAIAEAVEDPLRNILTVVGRQASIDFRHYKPTTILRRIRRRMGVTRSATLEDYARYLEQQPEEVGALVMAFLIKVTGFFRDAEAYEYLRRQVLPGLIAHGRANGRTLRLWSAGCATGEEPYSLALLVADLLGAELADWNVKIFATDLDEEGINFARRGLYPANLLAHLPEEYRPRFFEPVEQGYRVSKTLRQLVIFGQQDLSRGTPFPRIDLVVCRNVLIYFKPELQQSVLDMFAYALNETNGYLFLGQAETVRPSKATFEQVSKKWKIYRCTHGPVTMPAGPGGLFSVGGRFSARSFRAMRPTAGDRQTEGADPGPDIAALGQLRRFNDWMLRFLPLGVVVIDRSYRMLTVNAAARRILGIREVGQEQDFLHSVRGLPYTPVRAAIDSVFHERGTANLPELELMSVAGGDGRYVTLTIVPMQIEATAPDLAMISVVDATEQVQVRRRLETAQADQRQLVDELSAANRRLSDLNKELQDTNEELQAANEEMMLTQEELQATNEEFEATNEELQATNEELETNNEELQATNEELETTNEELHARTGELQDLTRSLADERRRLSEMVELAPFYIMVLRGPALIVEAFNPRYARMLEGRDVVGRPLEEVSAVAELSDAVSLVREAYHQDRARVTPRMRARVPGDGGKPVARDLIYTIVPSHDSEGRVDGVVLYAEDVLALIAPDADGRAEGGDGRAEGAVRPAAAVPAD